VAIERLGGRINYPATVIEHAPRGDVHHITVRKGDTTQRVISRFLVLAAGARSLSALPGAPALPLRPVKGQIIRLSGPPLISQTVRSPTVYLVPRRNGRLLVGASSEEMGFDARNTAGVIRQLLDDARRVLPGIDECAIDELNVGFRPALRDHLPAIGRAGSLFVSTGHFRHGIKLAPISAQLLVEQIISGQRPDALAPFDPNRFQIQGES
jgi:glycine oxidase